MIGKHCLYINHVHSHLTDYSVVTVSLLNRGMGLFPLLHVKGRCVLLCPCLWPQGKYQSWLSFLMCLSHHCWSAFRVFSSEFVLLHNPSPWNRTKNLWSDGATTAKPYAGRYHRSRHLKKFSCPGSPCQGTLCTLHSQESFSLMPTGVFLFSGTDPNRAPIFFHFCFSAPAAKFSAIKYVTWLRDEAAASCWNFRARGPFLFFLRKKESHWATSCSPKKMWQH